MPARYVSQTDSQRIKNMFTKNGFEVLDAKGIRAFIKPPSSKIYMEVLDILFKNRAARDSAKKRLADGKFVQSLAEGLSEALCPLRLQYPKKDGQPSVMARLWIPPQADRQ